MSMYNGNNYWNQKKELEFWGIQCFDNVPDEFISFLREKIDTNRPKNHELAGHIKEEYSYSNWPIEFQNWLVDQALSRTQIQNYLTTVNCLTENVPFVLQSLWVNLQKKYEFNPLHNHSGVLSFIIPLNVPYNLKDEDDYFPQSSYRQPATSRLSFLVNEPVGMPNTIEVNMDKSFENKMMMFPAKLMHMVYPFYTSDETRITVSGNISLETRNVRV